MRTNKELTMINMEHLEVLLKIQVGYESAGYSV